jgi:hypothetical protein
MKKLVYFDGTYQINPNCLDFMELAENRYKDAVLAKEWLQPDEDQQTILALQSKIEEVQAKASKTPKKREDRSVVIVSQANGNGNTSPLAKEIQRRKQ